MARLPCLSTVTGRHPLLAIGRKWLRGPLTDKLISEDDMNEAAKDRPGGPSKFPFLVRALAVAYVLSLVVQPVGFLLLGIAAAIVGGLRHAIDGWVVGLALGAAACAILCPAFRWGLRRWGQKHYPQE